MNKSETPRTDAFLLKHGPNGIALIHWWRVIKEHARQLERELSAAKAALNDMNARLRAESALADAGRKGWEDGMRKAAGILEARDARAYKHIKEYAEDNNATFDDNKYLLGRGDEAHGAYRAILAAIGEGR